MEYKKFISIGVLFLFGIFGFFFIKNRTHEFARILDVRLDYILILFLSALVMIFLRAHMFKTQMKSYGVNLRLKEWLSLEVTTEFWNAVTPFKGGIPARALYLKKKYGFSYVSSASLTVINYIVNFFLYGLCGVIVSFFIPVSENIRYGLLSFFGLVLFGSIFFVLFKTPSMETEIKFLRYFLKSISGVEKVRKDYRLLTNLFFNSCARFIIGAFRVYIAFLAFDYSVGFYNCLIINAFIGVTQLVSLTPMNLGFRESVVVLSSKLLGVGGVIGAFVAALDRVIGLAIVLFAVPFSSFFLSKNFSLKLNNDKKQEE